MVEIELCGISPVSCLGIQENSKVSENTSHRHFTNVVLAYITPW